MKFKIIFEQIAITDLIDILKYIAEELCAVTAASALLNRLIQAINSLEYMPLRNPVIHEPPYNLLKIRRMIFEEYVVFYRVNEKDAEVHILRVLNMRQQWTDYL